MDHPYYTVTVNSLAAGWSYSCYEGEEPNAADVVLLADGLTYHWEFTDGQIPGHLEPTTAGVGFVAITAGDLPAVETGDLIRLRVRIGTAGPYVIDETYRAAEPVVTLRPGATRAAHMQLELSDTLADWSSRFPTKAASTTGAFSWYYRLTAMRDALGWALGRPSSWPDDDTLSQIGRSLSYTNDDPMMPSKWGDQSADEITESVLNAYAVGGVHHTIVPAYGAAHPAGYQQVRMFGAAEADPVTNQRYELAPASRKVFGAIGLPFRLTIVAGITTIDVDQAYATMSRLPVVDAAWCTLPATARKSREHAVTVIQLDGFEFNENDAAASNTSASTERSRPDVDQRGAMSRSVKVQQSLVDSADVPTMQTRLSNAATRIAGVFLPDDTVFSSRWSFDAFTMQASLVPQAAAEKLLPLLVRGRADTDLVRHLTLHGIPDDSQLEGRSWINGFLTSGDLEIVGGEMTFTLTTAPGLPELEDTAAGITWADLAASAYEPTTWATLDPDLTAADFRLVRN